MAEPDKSLTFSFTFPKSTVQDMKKGFKQNHPNDETNSNGDPMFPDDNLWMVEYYRRLFIADIYDGLGKPPPDPVDYDGSVKIEDIVVF